MSQKYVSLRQMQRGVGLITALSLGLETPSVADKFACVPQANVVWQQVGEAAQQPRVDGQK